MSEYADIGGGSFPEFGDAFNGNGTMNTGIYFVGPDLGINPTPSLKTQQYTKVAFPGTFDGIGTVTLTYEAHPGRIMLAILGNFSAVAAYVDSLSATLCPESGARYTVIWPGSPERKGCKLAGHQFFPYIPIGLQGLIVMPLLCTFEQLSDEN